MPFNAVYETEGRAVFITNLMNIYGVSIYNVKQIDKICRFSVKGKYVADAEKALIEHDKSFVKIKDTTPRYLLRKNGSRIGLFAGVLLVAVFGVLWSRMVTEIRISGTNLVSNEKILQVVETSASVPTEKKNFNLDEVEKNLIAIDGVSNVSLEIKGNVFFIDILEELEPPEVVDYNEKSPLVSKYDAIVTRIAVYSGTPMVNVGDTVKKGDVLVSPNKTLADGSTTEIRTLGDVYGRIWLTKQCIITPTVIENVRTGKSKSYVLSAFGNVEVKSPYKTYETEEIVFTDTTFPLKLKKITFFETDEKERELSYADERESIIRRKTEDLEREIPEGSEKVRTWFSEKTVDKNVVLDIYYEIIIKLTD